MQDVQELPLKQLAIYAAQNNIKGSSFKRVGTWPTRTASG